MSTIPERINEGIKEAMRAKDAVRLSALRLMKNEISKVENDTGAAPTPEATLLIIKKMGKQRRDSIDQFRKGNREDLAAKEEAELKILESFLPAEISVEEMDAIIDKVLGEFGEIDPSMTTGMVIGRAMSALKATGLSFDGRMASERVLQRLKA